MRAMGGQMNQPLILNQPIFHGIGGILKKSFKLPNKNSMISNTFLLLVPFCLLILGADLTFVRVICDIITPMELLGNEDPSAKEILQDMLNNVWLLLGVEIFYLAFFCILSLFSLVAMVLFTTSRKMNHKDLFSRTGRLWTRQVISWFYQTFINVVCITLVLISMEFLSVKVVTGQAVIVVCLMSVILGTLCYVYVAAVWLFSMVMSIAEMDLTEIMVIEETEELVQGRRLQGFVLTLLTSFVSIGIEVAYAFETREIGEGMDTGKTNGIIMLCYLCLLKLLMVGLYSVYYNECKRKNGEQLHVEERMDYAAIPAV
ncbi:hypothetical protein ACHQM5_030275 [Ranunculus cassubicifolius]